MSASVPKNEGTGGGQGGAAALAGRLGARFGSLLQRGNSWANRVADTVKEAGRGSLLRQALDARERGNLAAAFWLLEEDHRARPEEIELAALFWDVAVEYGRAEDAAGAVAGLIRRHSTAGGPDLAVQYWCELVQNVPGALADPTALARIVPALQARVAEAADDESRAGHREILLQALRAIVDPRNSALSPGVALHTIELARDVDPPTAVAAARVALQSADLHEAKRAKLEQLVASFDACAPGDAPAPSGRESARIAPIPDPPKTAPLPAPAPSPAEASDDPARNHPGRTESPIHVPLSEEVVASLKSRLPPPGAAAACSTPAADVAGTETEQEVAGGGAGATVRAEKQQGTGEEAVVERALEQAVESAITEPRPPHLKVMPGVLHALEDAALSIEVAPGRRARVEYAKIEALAVAQVPGAQGEPIFVIDLLLDRGGDDAAPRRVIRLHRSVSEPGLCEILGGILERSHAVPLPDPDAALGIAVPSFDSLEAYERATLSLHC